MIQIDEQIFQMGGSSATKTMLFEGRVYSLGHVHVYTLPLDVTPNRVVKNVVVPGHLQKSQNFQDFTSTKGAPPCYEI